MRHFRVSDMNHIVIDIKVQLEQNKITIFLLICEIQQFLNIFTYLAKIQLLRMKKK